MTNLVIKGRGYRLIDNKSFDMPLPLKCVVLKEDTEIAEYEISADESVSYNILTKYKENMITPINRPLSIADMYYLFSCRVFQDKTPYTLSELSLLGLDKYNVYNIIRKTRGITPYDTYWVRFEGDNCDYEKAYNTWNDLMSQVEPDSTTDCNSAAETGTQNSSSPESLADLSEILHQHKVDVAAEFEHIHEEEVREEQSGVPKNTTMSEDEIEKLLMQSGLIEASEPAAEEPTPEPETSGGNMSPEDIAKLFAASDNAQPPVPEVNPEIKAEAAKMSQEDIEKMLSEVGETPELAPVEEAPKTSGGNMSPEDIAKLFAEADNTAAPEPAPVEEAPKTSGGNISPEDIAKLFAEADNTATPEPAPVEEAPKTSGGNMSPEDIAKLFAEADNTATPEPAPVEEAPKTSGGNMSPEDIAKLFAEADNTAAPEPAPVEEAPKTSGGNMTPEDIAKLFAEADNTAAPEPAPVEEAPKTSGGNMSPEEIEALLGDMKKDAQT